MNFLISSNLIKNLKYEKKLKFQNFYIYFNKLFFSFEEKGRNFIIFGNITKIIGYKFSHNLLKKKIMEKNYEHLFGRYVIIDNRLDKTNIISNFSGRVDLFYMKQFNQFKISTNIEDLLPFINKENINNPVLAHSLSIYGFRAPKKNTIFDEIKRVAPRGIISLRKKSLTIKEPTFKLKKIDKNLKVQDFYDYFMTAIESASSKNGNYISLSSGWDSTSILAALIKLKDKKKITCFTGRMKFSKKSGVINKFEISRAKKISNYYGIKLKIIDYDYTENSSLEEISNHIEVLKKFHLVSLPAISQMQLCKRISKNYNGETFFTGEGSDGLQNFGFSQYATLYYDKSRDFREYSDKMLCYLFGPTFIDKIFKGSASDDLIYKFLKKEKNIITSDFKSEKKGILSDIFVSFFLRNIRFPNSSETSLNFLTKKGRKNYQDYFLKNYFKKSNFKFDLNELYSFYLSNYKLFHWQSATSLSRDYAAENFNINISHPFLDDSLIDFFSKVPESWGRGLELNNTKFALKNILKYKLDYPYHLQDGPHSYTYDVLPGFSIINEFLNNPLLRGFFIKKINSSSMLYNLDKNLFNLKYFQKLIKKYKNNYFFDNNSAKDLSSIIYHSFYF